MSRPPGTSGPSRRRVAAMLCAGALVVAACTSTPPEVVVTTGELPNQDVVALPETEDARVQAAVAELPELVASIQERSGVPGIAVAVVHRGSTVFAEGYGVREVGKPEAIDPDTVFQIASVSKSISATAVARAIGDSDDRLAWDTPISTLLPGFAFSDPVVTERATIGDAFSHRTGLLTGSGDDLEDLGFDRAQILEKLRLLPLDEFRSSYHYSNFGLTVGAEAVAASRGQQWEDAVDELIIDPLGMTSTSPRHADYLASANRAVLHARVDGEFQALYDRQPDAEAPAGGISSNVRDLAAWMTMVLAQGRVDGQPLVDEEALLAATSAQIVSSHSTAPDQRPSHYGYGFNVSPQVGGRMAISHSGAFSLGAGTAYQLIPDLDLGIVVLTNGAPVGAAESVMASFMDTVQFGEPTRDWLTDFGPLFAPYEALSGDLVGMTPPASPAPPPPASALIGRYANPYFGTLVISETGGQIDAALGPDGNTHLALEPWDGTMLSYRPAFENALPGSQASAVFTLGADGRAESVKLDTFDTQGFGTFTREE